MIDQAINALRTDPVVYQRGGQLCTVVRDLGEGGSLRIDGARRMPRIAPLSPGRLTELLGDNADWIKGKVVEGETVERRVAPPSWVARGVLDRLEWAGIRRLEAIVESPTMRPDGTILDSPGYDERTAVYAENLAGFSSVEPEPTLSAAGIAAGELLELVSDFPFAGEEHRAAWLAAALTPLARFAILGACPLFLFDAPTPGAGKSKLADMVAILATAREADRTPYTDRDDELSKIVTSLVQEGRRIVLLDNVAVPLGGSSLEAAITSATWSGRLLGTNRTTGNTPLNAIWLATGNNVQIKGDMPRRIVPCRLIPADERPENRGGFRFPDLLPYLQRERGRLVAAGLTILRAHAAAGMPDCGLTPFGSFESWSRVVRGAVYRATGLDPCATRAVLDSADPERTRNTAIVEGWATIPGGSTHPGLAVGEAIERAKTERTGDGPFLEALRDVAGPALDARAIGRFLLKLKDRRFGAATLRGVLRHKQMRYWSERAA